MTRECSTFLTMIDCTAPADRILSGHGESRTSQAVDLWLLTAEKYLQIKSGLLVGCE